MELQKEIAALSPERRNLLALMLENNAEAAASAQKIPRRNAEKTRVSFAQQRLWFLQKLNPSDATYNTPAALKISGGINIEILERVFNFLILRHETLRLIFKEEKGSIFQLIQKPFAVEIIGENLDEINAAEKQSVVEKMVGNDIAIPFDLEQLPLFRVHLYDLGNNEHILLLNMHHIISDGWSLGVLIEEFVTLYKDFSNGKKPSLPELEIQYSDFAKWERKMIEGQAWRSQLDYWKNNLSERIGNLKITFAGTSDSKNSDPVETVSILLRAGLVNEIRRICSTEHYTLYTFLLTAFQVLLYRYSGQKKFIIGSPVANRNRIETEGLIGCFINPLAIKTNLDGNLSFSDLLNKTRKNVLDAFDNQEIPFELILDSIRRERNEPQNRLFNVWFVLQNAPLSEIELPDLKITNFKIPRIASQFDIAMNINETGQEIHCAIDYPASLFDADFIWQMLEHFKLILSAGVRSRELKLSEINLGKTQNAQQPANNYNEDDFDF